LGLFGGAFRIIFKTRMERQTSETVNAFWRKFSQDRWAMSGLFFITILFLVSLFGAWIRPDSSENANDQEVEWAKLPPMIQVHFGIDDKGERNLHENNMCKTFVLGTDRLGRDVLSRLMAGTYISLTVGFISVAISLMVGVSIGLLAGYYRGWVDNALSWIINVIWSIPNLLVVMAFVLAFGAGFWKVFIAIGLTMWVEVARIVRGQILSIREKEYIEAARAMGMTDGRIMLREMLPQLWPILIVISAANFSSAILIESGMSFLGLGVQIPAPSWGNMIRENYAMIPTQHAHLALAPGICIMLTVLALSYVGNGLRTALDIKKV
jgi:ABC-type dipeptide/oligopeptide/nickel transport system permease subunit